jgi:hypothetical protein
MTKDSPSKGLKGQSYSHSKIVQEVNLEEEEAIKMIELPKETLYLIDKVVRQKIKQGPIGIDNSELINMEIEDEYK